MQTRQQLRDQEFNRSIALHLTPVPASIIRNYVGSELSLSPLERNESGTPQTTPSNTLILNSIFNEFGQDYPGSTLFKNEITETHHRKTLDPLFTEKETRWESRNLLKELILNNPEALQQRKQDLRSVVHYWSFSECEKQLTDEMAGSKRTDFNGDEVIKLRTVTVDLLIDALKQRRHSPETELIRERELEYSRAQSILIQAHTRLTIDPESACDLILKALQIFCNLNKKREAVGLVILLIEQSVRFPRTDFDHIMQLFSAAKALCLCYPTSDDLYAKLLFAIDGSCYQRSQFTQLKKIYDEAHTNPLKLKYSYNAKFTFRHIMADHHAGESTLTSMMRVNCALDNFLPRLVGGRDFPSFIDLSRGEFMRSVAKLFRLAAVITDLHARRITQWNEQQLAEILSLIKHENPKQLREPYKPCANYAGLNFRPALSNASSQARLLSASAEYYKTALKILLEFEEDREPETPRLIVSLFDNLVQLYQKNRNVEDLELLLHKTTLAKFNKMQIFKSNISGWRKVLRQLKKEASEA